MKYLRHAYNIARPLIMTGLLAITGCADTITRTEHEAERKKYDETIQLLRDDLTGIKNDYEKSLAEIKRLVTERTTIDALIPKVGEAKKEILEQLRKDYDDLIAKWNNEKNTLENSRRKTVSDLEQQKRWFKQTAEPAIGKPEDAEGPATGIYADRKKIENHETRLANQKDTLHKLKENLAYDRIVEEWKYDLLLVYKKTVQQSYENPLKKLDALKSVKPEERAKAWEAFELEMDDFEKNIEALYQQQKEKRKKLPPRPEEKND